MIKNYFILNKISNLKKVICFFFIFFLLSQISKAQCTAPIIGCSNTDLMNYGSNSNNDAATIEYDNFVSAFHTTAARTPNGSFQVWGEDIANDGTSDVLSPLTINASNFPALTNAVPVKIALGSAGQTYIQGILLATDGLYAWSSEGMVLDASITSGTAFQKLTIDGNTNGLPPGVTPRDVKMMFATFMTLVITTCSGEVWVISQAPSLRGNGAAGNSKTWYRVTTSDAGNPALTDVVACRGSYNGLMALKSDGSIYAWGNNVYLGNNTPLISNQNRAVKMTLPVSIIPKMIGSTSNGVYNGTTSYYILAIDGNLYCLGENSFSELGDFTTENRLSWVQPRYPSEGNPIMNDIKWISPQEHDRYYGSINVINNNKTIYAFGFNSSSMLGTPNSDIASDPTIPNGLNTADEILTVETGGHTSMIVKNCEAKFGYVGHRVSGSMGNGSSAIETEAIYTFKTAGVQICGAESVPAIHSPIGKGPNSGYCLSDPVILDPTPSGGMLTVVSGPGTLTGNTLNFTGIGTVKVRYIVGTGCGAEAKIVYKEFNAVQCPMDLQITKEIDNLNPSVGHNAVFTITATNNGPYKATGVSVNDVLPAGYTFISAAPSAGTWSAPKWIIGDLSAGTSAVLIIKADVKPSGPYANTAVITGNDPDTNPANNTATVTPVVQADLAVTKKVSNAKPNAGDNVTFTITASNAGPSDAAGVTIQDVLPSGYTFVGAAPSAGTWSSPDWTINRLINGASETLTITAIVNAAGSYTNTADISAMEEDPQQGNNSASSTPVVNHSPIANNDDLSAFPLQEDGIDETVNILTNDTDPDGNPAAPLNGTGQFTVDLNPALAGIQTAYTDTKGSWSLNTATGIVTFDPANNFNGTALLTYTLCDAAGLCDNADITFAVAAVNDAPAANNDTAVTNEDTSAAINLVTNTAGLDTDSDGTINPASVDLNPAAAGIQKTFTVTGEAAYAVDNTGLVTFTPALNFNGTSIVNYTVQDNLGLMSNTASLTITITPVNDAPAANNDTVVTNENTSAAINILTNTSGLDTDIDGTIDPATVDLNPAAAGIQKTFTITGEGTCTVDNTGLVTFTPALNFNGISIVNYTVQDNLGLVSNTASLTITVTAVNDAPIANNDTTVTNEDRSIVINVVTNTAGLDTDSDGTIDPITVDLNPAAAGIQKTFTITGEGTYTVDNTGLVTFTPALNFSGTSIVNYTVQDNLGLVSNIASLTITVTPVNDAPAANNDTAITNEDTSAAINVVSNTAGLDTDTDGTIDPASVDLNPAAAGIQNTFTVTGEGTYTVDNTGLVTFTPALNFNGTSIVNYTVQDNLGLVSNTATLTITVTAVNDAPIAHNDTAVTNENTSAAINVVTNTAGLDTDIDGIIDAASVDLNIAAAGIQKTFTVTGQGTYTVDNTGLVTFTPVLNYSGISGIKYTVQDNLGLVSNIAELIITITPAVNQPPSALDDTNTPVLSTDGPAAVNALKGTDTDGTIASYTILTLPAHGLLALSGVPVNVNQVLTPIQAAVLTYDPDGTFTGNDTFTFTVTDNKGAADPTPAVITMIVSKALLQAVNDPLSLADGINGSSQVVNVLNNDTLNSAAVLSSEVIINAVNFPFGITLNSDGTIDTAPNTAPGNHTLTYQICEKANPTNCSTATVQIFIEAPAVAIVKTGVFNDINGNGYTEEGETITYSFTITNRGNTDLQNITVSDPLPGIMISGGPVSLAVGQSDNSSFTAVYSLTQADINSGSVTNQAAVSAVTNSGIAVQDKSDFADPAADNPTIIELSDCLLKIFNAVSANGDQDNNRFYIQGMECHPENTVQIYNRWGVLVFEKEHYNNNDIAFKGISEGRVTIQNSNGLPEGTYYYIIKYKDKKSKPQQKAGYLYLTK